MNTKNNQRAKNTNESIVRATFAIMTETNKPVDKITVREICERAGINRSTFYAHYMDVFDVVEKVERTMAEKLTRSFLGKLEEGHRLDACYVEMFRFIREYQEFYRLYFRSFLRSEVIGVAWDLLKDRVEQLSYQSFGFQSQEEMAYHGEFFVFGLTAVLRHWVGRECRETPEELMAILRRHYHPPVQLFQWGE